MTRRRVRLPGEAGLLDAAANCASRPAVESAVYLAAIACPDLSLEECANLPIGQRDDVLIAMRAALFGTRLQLGAVCPSCRAAIDVSVSTDDLPRAEINRRDDSQRADPDCHVRVAGDDFWVRAVTSRDLAAAALADSHVAKLALARRCLVALDHRIDPAQLPDEALDEIILARIGAILEACDPAADPYVSLNCANCGTGWNAPIDIGAVLTADLTVAAEFLIDDVHALALAYHWSEAEIFALPPPRRRAYLERLRG